MLAGVLAHTPYDGSSPPFTIGLSSIEASQWIEVDGQLGAYLAEKDRLWRDLPERVFAADADSAPAQEEVLELLIAHLPVRYPESYRVIGEQVHVGSRVVSVHDGALPALRRAASLVQEDLLIMRKGADGWRLAAGSLSFPSSWHLLEKFGKPMPQIHGTVPGFGRGSRNMSLVERMFDHLRPQHLFVRYNWGLYDGAELYHPAAGNGMRRLGEDGGTGHIHLRVERQTLRKLPRCGDILFTIRTHLDPLDTLAAHRNGSRLAWSLHDQVARLSPEQLAYKGLSAERDRLLARLQGLAGGQALDSQR